MSDVSLLCTYDVQELQYENASLKAKSLSFGLETLSVCLMLLSESVMYV